MAIVRWRVRHLGRQHEIKVPAALLSRVRSQLKPFLNKPGFHSKLRNLRKDLARHRRKNRIRAGRMSGTARWTHVQSASRGLGQSLTANPQGALYVVVARRHSGRGLNAENGCLSIALCHSSVRRACKIGDQILVLSSVSSQTAQPPAYAQAISDFQAQSLTGSRKVVAYGVISALLPAAHYYKSYSDRRDAWYYLHSQGVYKGPDGTRFSLRARFNARGRKDDHKFGPNDLLPVILCRQFRIWPTNLEGSPWCPLQLPDRWSGRNCCRFETMQRAVLRSVRQA